MNAMRGVKDDIGIHLPEALMAIMRRVAALAKMCIVTITDAIWEKRIDVWATQFYNL